MSDETVYKIRNFDNSGEAYIVPENSVVSDECSISFIGKDLPNYGEIQSTNFLHLLQNFASASGSEPGSDGKANPVTGQIWYEKLTNSNGSTTDDYKLHVYCNGWKELPKLTIGSDFSKLNASNADMFFNSTTKSLYVYNPDSASWVKINESDKEHAMSNNIIQIFNYGDTKKIINISGYSDNVTSEGETSGIGCCVLSTIKIVMKEVFTKQVSSMNPRSKAYIIKCLTQYDGTNLKMVGLPNYETIGYNEASDWSAVVDVNDSSDKGLKITLETSLENSNSYIISEIQIDGVKI